MTATIKTLSLSKEYYSTRMALTDSMHLFLLYDAKDPDAKDYWEDYLKDLLEKFPKHLNLSIIPSEGNVERGLIDVFKDGKNIEITDYPGVILSHPHLTEPQIALGVTPTAIYSLVEKYDHFYSNDFETEKSEQFAKIKTILESFPIICFIKGTPQDPYCKFSRKFIELINQCQIRYKCIDIFKDEKIRCYLRLYANWKTFPQLYINGKIIGGVDKLTDLIEKGEFMPMVPNEMKIDTIVLQVKELIIKKAIVFFIDGDYNKSIISLAEQHKMNYDVFDIKKDMMVERILRKDYEIKDFPAMFIGGKYIGNEETLKGLFQ